MDGPGHYREAEKIIEHVSTDSDVRPETRRDMIAAAQVHATLALAPAANDDERNRARLVRLQRDAAVAELDELQAAVRAYVAAPVESDVPGNAGECYDRLRDLVAGA